MNKKLFIVIPLLLFALQFVEAQTPFFRQHQIIKGKEEYNVRKIFQDPKGWIWFGTDHGLFRFDGVNYTSYTTSEGLADDQITAISSAKDGKLWVGHRNGEISIYDGFAFKVFVPEEGLGRVEISDIVSDSAGIMWYSTLGEGIYRYDGRYLTNLNTDDGISDNNVYSIEIDSKGVLWLATDNGITRYISGHCDIISMKNGLNDNIVRVVKSSNDGRIWIGTEERGLTIYDPDSKTFTEISNWDFGAVTGFTISLENDIWVSTEKQGIIQVKLNGNFEPSYRKITVDQGLISNRISTIIKDREQNIWIGGKQGVIQALPPIFEFLNKTNGTPFSMVYNLLIDKVRNIWICSEYGLFRGVPDNTGQFQWQNISKETGLEKVNFISLYIDKQDFIWAGTYGNGVYRINPKNLKFKEFGTREGLIDNNVISISGTNERMWFSTLGGGVSCYNYGLSRILNFHFPELDNSYVYAAKTDASGRTWIAGSLKYPSYIYNDSLYRAVAEGHKYSQLYSVAFDTSGGIWFNTRDNGIIHLIADSAETLDKRSGIGHGKIQSIVFDKFNNLVVISDMGLQFYKPGTGESIEFSESSGLAYLYPILNSVYTDNEGKIWIGTENGLIKYNPEYLKLVDQDPKVFLSLTNLFYNPIPENRSVFKASENNFTFGYTGIWFQNPEGLFYRYMLEGFDLSWNYSNRNQVLPYSKLPAGHYSFKVEVSLDQKTWYSSSEAVFSFRVKPPVWQRWWFLLLSLLLIISGIYLYIKRRLANLEKAKKELELEVHKRTEEIRNQNEILEIQKEEIAAQRDHAEEQRDKIEAQKEEIQASIRYAHRIQTAALPPKNQMDTILGDYFILNKPRDIVSGDFFWVAKNESSLFFAVGDCTGHGVPGAFMSMLGLSALNDIVKSLKVCSASIILDTLRERIQESLHQLGEIEFISTDGMDISLCIFDTKSYNLQFAAAHNPLYIIRNKELIVISADKMEIGSTVREQESFTNNNFKCRPGDILYLFSDGFPDQFGGNDGRKYKYQKFKEYLVTIHEQPLQKQKWMLDEEIESWKGHHPQVDDIMVMGVKIL
jgi:ligand-binding sensor domain-containing protein/serine phosphatase RsbU (regulator of sigma subunit)